MKLTKQDFENAGYSRADATRLAADRSKNWKATNGGKRVCSPESAALGFSSDKEAEEHHAQIVADGSPEFNQWVGETKEPVDYTQARAGDGKQGPHPDLWIPWKHSKPITREALQELAIGKYLREAGFAGGNFERPHVFTVWYYREGDPCHPNGWPMIVHTVTVIAHPKPTAQ